MTNAPVQPNRIITVLNEELAALSDEMFIKFSIDGTGPPPADPALVSVCWVEAGK
ncbi:hypothetical protein O9992_21750 [Vibrio lentus]|nr:hypothetical protein [Vibrio lentus]